MATYSAIPILLLLCILVCHAMPLSQVRGDGGTTSTTDSISFEDSRSSLFEDSDSDGFDFDGSNPWSKQPSTSQGIALKSGLDSAVQANLVGDIADNTIDEDGDSGEIVDKIVIPPSSGDILKNDNTFSIDDFKPNSLFDDVNNIGPPGGDDDDGDNDDDDDEDNDDIVPYPEVNDNESDDEDDDLDEEDDDEVYNSHHNDGSKKLFDDHVFLF